MRCPSCNALNESGATACITCGLLLLKIEPPRRRVADQVVQKRRADDQAEKKRRTADSLAQCPYCKGEVSPEAVYCKHCQAILNEEYRLKATKRLRANINYASWVAYIFGLMTFLLFRPVGLISIAAGMILSIVYYAMPEVERQPRGDKKGFAAIWPFLKAQFRLDRTAVPLPGLKKKRLVFVGTPLVAALIGYGANFFFLQQPMNQVLSAAGFEGIEVSTHYKYWVVPGEVVFNLQAVDGKKAVDVHTVLLEYAKKMKDDQFKSLELQFRGKTRFLVEGTAFQKLGHEYDRRNFAYVLFEFPKILGAQKTAEEPKGLSDHDALMLFHDQWYASEVRE